MAKRSARAPKVEVDIDDEKSVEAEMAAALDVDTESLFIEADKNYESFGVATVWRAEVGTQEYFVVENFDAAYSLAVEMVKQDLETEPEIFNQSFIEQHIDEKKLAEELHADVLDRNLESLKEHGTADFWTDAEGLGMYVPEEDEDGERRDPTEEEINELAEKLTDAELKDPMQYLEDIYGKEDAVKEAIRIAGIDIDAAADDAIDTDGPGAYLSSYDGEIHDTPGGFVYWRHN